MEDITKVNIIVSGNRRFKERIYVYECLRKVIDCITNGDPEKYDVCIITGGSLGVDTYAEEYAAFERLKCMRVPAKWIKQTHSAGWINNHSAGVDRNAEIISIVKEDANAINLLVAFKNVNSAPNSGTNNMIEQAKNNHISFIEFHHSIHDETTNAELSYYLNDLRYIDVLYRNNKFIAKEDATNFGFNSEDDAYNNIIRNILNSDLDEKIIDEYKNYIDDLRTYTTLISDSPVKVYIYDDRLQDMWAIPEDEPEEL